MSTYYTYYLGYEKDNKIYPLGPFDYTGKLLHVISRSRSFASELYNYFWQIPDDDKLALSDRFKDALRSEWECDESEVCQTFNNVLYLPIDDMPTENAVVDGYFLIEDVKSYLEDNSDYDLFYDRMTPLEYAERLRGEIKSDIIDSRSCKDYMYFRYKKTSGLAAETTAIIDMFKFIVNEKDKNLNYVVICDIS